MGKLHDLDPLATNLKTARDSINQTLQTIQDRLNAKEIGVEVWLEKSLEESEWRQATEISRERTETLLGYGRSGEGWALLVRTRLLTETLDTAGWRGPGPAPWDEAIQDSYDNEDEKPLLRASQALRFKAIALISDLIDALKVEGDRLVAAADAAKQLADSLE
jgi:hypothetical protein